MWAPSPWTSRALRHHPPDEGADLDPGPSCRTERAGNLPTSRSSDRHSGESVSRNSACSVQYTYRYSILVASLQCTQCAMPSCHTPSKGQNLVVPEILMPPRTAEPIITPAILSICSSTFLAGLDLARTFWPKSASTVVHHSQSGPAAARLVTFRGSGGRKRKLQRIN